MNSSGIDVAMGRGVLVGLSSNTTAVGVGGRGVRVAAGAAVALIYGVVMACAAAGATTGLQPVSAMPARSTPSRMYDKLSGFIESSGSFTPRRWLGSGG